MKQCIICGKEFEKKSNNKKCCSKECSKTNGKQIRSLWDKNFKRIEYKRKWKEKNRDLINQQAREKRKNNIEKAREYQKLYREKNKEYMSQKVKEYRQCNEKIKEWHKNYSKNYRRNKYIVVKKKYYNINTCFKKIKPIIELLIETRNLKMAITDYKQSAKNIA